MRIEIIMRIGIVVSLLVKYFTDLNQIWITQIQMLIIVYFLELEK